MCGHGIVAARNALGIDGGGGIFSAHIAAIRRPTVGKRMLGIEITGLHRGSNGLALHDFGVVDRTRRARRNFRLPTEIEHHAGTQTGAFETGVPQVGLVRWHDARIVLPCPLVIGLNQAEADASHDRKINASAENRSNAIARTHRTGKVIVTEQCVREEIDAFPAPREPRTYRVGAHVKLIFEI